MYVDTGPCATTRGSPPPSISYLCLRPPSPSFLPSSSILHHRLPDTGNCYATDVADAATLRLASLVRGQEIPIWPAAGYLSSPRQMDLTRPLHCDSWSGCFFLAILLPLDISFGTNTVSSTPDREWTSISPKVVGRANLCSSLDAWRHNCSFRIEEKEWKIEKDGYLWEGEERDKNIGSILVDGEILIGKNYLSIGWSSDSKIISLTNNSR